MVKEVNISFLHDPPSRQDGDAPELSRRLFAHGLRCSSWHSLVGRDRLRRVSVETGLCILVSLGPVGFRVQVEALTDKLGTTNILVIAPGATHARTLGTFRRLVASVGTDSRWLFNPRQNGCWLMGIETFLGAFEEALLGECRACVVRITVDEGAATQIAIVEAATATPIGGFFVSDPRELLDLVCNGRIQSTCQSVGGNEGGRVGSRPMDSGSRFLGKTYQPGHDLGRLGDALEGHDVCGEASNVGSSYHDHS